MKIYIFENYRDFFPEKRGSELTDALMMKAIESEGIRGATIVRGERGKPLVKGAGELFVSVSHSGAYLVCALSELPVGIDVQEERGGNLGKITGRYFSEEEQAYVDERGRAGFFALWTRKEAYSKYTGRGLEEVMKGTSVLMRDDVDFTDFQIEKGVYCSCCVKKQKKWKN